MIRAALWFDETLGMEILFIGRDGLERIDCRLEVSGRHLSYAIVIDGGYIFVRAQPMDSIEPLELLFSIGDCRDGWRTVARFVAALERSGITSLKERPIELGEPGPGSFVIG